MKMDSLDNCFVAHDAEELIAAFDDKATHILIPKHFKEEFLENTILPPPLSASKTYALEFGDKGKVNASATPFFYLVNWLSKDSKQQKR